MNSASGLEIKNANKYFSLHIVKSPGRDWSLFLHIIKIVADQFNR
jgi:hypothetical protein